MRRCFQLALKGMGKVAPNPLVGCVIVKDEEVIGEGYHQRFGDNHAEVNAIGSVKEKAALKGATLYVNLEPCTHHGKTPPCADEILKHGISKVVIAGQDPSEKINGKGIEKLRKSGVEVVDGFLLEDEEVLNRRFRVFHQKKRPYIILKWAESADGFMDIDRSNGEKGSFRISNEASRRLLHKWRSEEQAIMIGTNTALTDNPSLDVRLVEGRNPLRVVLDLKGRLPGNLNIFADGNPTLLYSNHSKVSGSKLIKVPIQDEGKVVTEMLMDLYHRDVQSVLVEGGKKLLESFMMHDIWDEIRVFRSSNNLKQGLRAVEVNLKPIREEKLRDNSVLIYRRNP